TSLLLATATLLFVSIESTILAGSATWDSNPGTGDWNTNSNWTPATGFPNGALDVATFGMSNTTSVGISANTTVAGITFNGLSSFTITVAPTFALTVQGTGMTNSSGLGQNFVLAQNATSNGSFIFFEGATSTAGAGGTSGITYTLVGGAGTS